MRFSKKWTSVTPLSKAIALALLVALPFIGFALGRNYQKKLDSTVVPEMREKNKED